MNLPLEKNSSRTYGIVFLATVLLIGSTVQIQAEAILQFFNNTWNEITYKMPEIAEAGYSALWLPPPQKASGGLSVGYDLWDPFDLGSKDQRNSIKTRYGTEEELLRLIQTAHRFGIRVYFDNIMNHRAFDVPGWDENTAIDIYPGMVPEDFHLRVTEEGFYRKWDNTVNWGSTWEVQNRNLSDLIDIAHETPNANFGASEGQTHPKLSFVRQPDNPEYYDYHPTLGHVGFGSTNITTAVITNNPDFYSEDVGGYLMRSIRWLVDKTKVDGLRLDAVKHVPGYFFGEQWAVDKDSSDSGYCGQAQWQFNMTRGYSDWDNHRDTVFDTEKSYGRNDLMIFGEHMGEPPPYGDYWAAGMRLLDARTHSTLNNRLGNPWETLSGLEHSYYISGTQMGENLGIYYAKSHDDNIAFREELHNALNLTRAGVGDIYTDGNRQAETLGQSGGAFPRHANTAYLGQWGDNRIPNLLYIHNQFARSWQYGRLGDSDVVAYDRIDKRENSGMSDADGAVLCFMLNDNYSAGEYREIPTAFPEGAYLWQYATAGAGFYTQVEDGKIKVIIPPGGYFAFSWRNPEESVLWKNAGGNPVTIYESDGSEAGWVSYERKDGPDGDPGFNPYGVADNTPNDFTYTYFVPRVTSQSNVSFVARVDGSAYNVMMKLDGGMNLNTNTHSSGDPRDHPPGNEGSTSVYEGYEQAQFHHRQHREKFAAKDANRNIIGSAGSESYEATIGSAGVTVNAAATNNDFDATYTASYVYHDPADTISASNQAAVAHFNPAPESAGGGSVDLWVKIGNACDVNKVFVYYTTDGQSWPEGAGGAGIGSTKVAEASYIDADQSDGDIDWWKATLPTATNGMVLRYKIGAARWQGDSYGCSPAWDTPFPNSEADIERKTQMMGVWQVTNIHPASISYRPHNDFSLISTGLVEGFHMIRARAFLQRDGYAAIYNTFDQTFYLDTQTPEGEIKFPGSGETYWQNAYGVVVRTDHTVDKVLFNITDSNDANDDGQTGSEFGNGTNALGKISWVEAYEVAPSLSVSSDYPNEWRFTYNNIPTNGQGILRVRLLELSSSTNMAYNAVDGHYTELVITNDTRGPDTVFAWDWPTEDGASVQQGWTIRINFSSSLGDGYTDEEMLNRFLIRINDVAQGRDDYRLNRGSGIGTLEFDVPDLYNGDLDFLHHIVVTYLTSGGVTLQANRYVTAQPVDSGPRVQIISPPEYDQDGKPFEIVLPDVASPSTTQRQYRIRVQTDADAEHVWIQFTNSSGSVYREASITNELTGTVSVVNGTNILTGSNTVFDQELGTGNTLLIAGQHVQIASVLASNSLRLVSNWNGATASGLTAYRIDGNPRTSGSSMFWDFMWTNMTEGSFQFAANVNTNDATTNLIHASQLRNATVIFREMVNSNTNDLDDDDDGLYDSWETTPTNLPSTNPETWTSGDVHIWQIYGKTDATLPDTDGDGLPDGLESGWRNPVDPGQTETNVDTNGDGWPNFMGDLDPPFYNTVPDNSGVPNYNFNGSRTLLLAGTMTDPNNPDTDYDGLIDSVEDANRNGWVDGDGDPLYLNQDKSTRTNWPTKVWNTSWTETDPNDSDSDDDGASDGYGEDTNFNGRIDGDINSNRVYDAGEAWQETDPLNPDTDGDGLPDGWEYVYNLDPLDDGTDSLRTATASDGDPVNGPGGNPDNDVIVIGGVTNDYVNILEYQNGTNPRQEDALEPPPEGSMTVGPGDAIGVINGATNYEHFIDWTWDDLIVLDEYDGGGGNNQQGDVYLRWDGFDTSRDIVAFYARDGGDSGAGDGRFYFRLDFYDLQAFAEEDNLDIYVVIDFGNPASGEAALPDDVDAKTSNRWEAVVAVYQSDIGRVYVDTDYGNNSVNIGEDLTGYGVEVRDQNHSDGFKGAYFSAELDAVEFAISRDALTRDGLGWNGIDAGDLNYQVYVTKDGTCNSCGEEGGPGNGDIGGRNDICDTIYDDDVSEDYWEAQQGIRNVLSSWFSGDNQAGRTKLAMVVHGNQAVQPGSVVQDLINDGAGAGYHRLLEGHDIYDVPVNLHITPTLASAIEWARVDTNSSPTWRDGPAFNDRIATLASTGVVAMLASTFSDHIMPYFTTEFNQDNVALADEFLETIYGVTFTTNTPFWTPERVLDEDTFGKILASGYQYTLLDQNTHLWNWFGRTDALGDNGYSINRIAGVKTFVINNLPTDYRFENHDGGLPMPLRRLFIRRAQSNADRLITVFSNWEDFADKDNADAYDINLRWIANHPWIELVSLEDIAAGNVDLTGDGSGNSWWAKDRDADGLPTLSKQSHNWVNHATQGNYDNWYLGSSQEQGLQNVQFDVRPGTKTPDAYGMMFTDGLITQAWSQVSLISDTNVKQLARSVLHASVFQTAFHDEDNNDLSRWSTGDYIYPDTSSNSVASFARIAQAQSRMAAIYERVDDWAAIAASVTTPQTSAEDIDLDGEDEYLLYNDRLFAMFERTGGRVEAVWVREPLSGTILQTVGNFVSYAGTESELQGGYNVETNGNVAAYRTTALKDWWASAQGTQYVNSVYSFIDWTNGWRLTSGDSAVQKTITLDQSDFALEVAYALSGTMAGQPIYIRNGFSPNLYNLLLYGQDHMGDAQDQSGAFHLNNTNYVVSVQTRVGYRDGSHTAGYNPGAVDDNPGEGIEFYTLNMRNQAHTHQVELVGTNSFTFSLEFPAVLSDWDEDGMPNTYEDEYGFDSGNSGDGSGDADSDGFSNSEEYIAATNPTNDTDYLHLSNVGTPGGTAVRFDAKTARRYQVWYNDIGLINPVWSNATPGGITVSTDQEYEWTDDGSTTDPDPDTVSRRFYRIDVSLP